MADDFELDLLRDNVRRLAEQIAERNHAAQAAHNGTSRSQDWAAIAKAGLLCAGLSEEDGGFGNGESEVAAVMNEVGYGLILEPILPNLISARLIARLGSEAQKATWLPQLIDGSIKSVFGYAERNSGLDLANIETTVRRTDDGFIVNGHKTTVAGGNDASLMLTLVRDGSILRLLVIPLDADGVTVHRFALVDDTGACDVGLTCVALGADADLAASTDIAAVIAEAIDFASVAVSAEAVGAMTSAFEATLDFVKQRVQFGKPIGSNQALQHRLVDLHILLKEADSLTRRAIAALPGDAHERALAVSAAKIATCDAARKVGHEAIQMHGGIGITNEARISHVFRRLIRLRMVYGTADQHRTRFGALLASPALVDVTTASAARATAAA